MSGRPSRGRKGEPGAGRAAAQAEGTEARERRRQRRCPSCAGTSMIRGCRVPGVQLQVVSRGGELRSGLIGLYSDVCVDCGLTSFYARRAEVAEQLQHLEAASPAPVGGAGEKCGLSEKQEATGAQ